MTNCTFTGNTAEIAGAGIYSDLSNPTVIGCNFAENSGLSAGGVFNMESTATVLNCTFYGNTTSDSGGGMYNKKGQSTIKDCLFIGNTSGDTGGGMVNNQSNVSVINCAFADNFSDSRGGGMSNLFCDPTITNCSFAGNTTNTYGALANYSSNPIIVNCILWDDDSDEIFNDNSTPSVSYSDVQGGYGGTGNIDADPLFANPNNDDYRLQQDPCQPGVVNPCVDTGDPTSSVTGTTRTDWRRDSGIVDMGYHYAVPRHRTGRPRRMR